LLKTALLGLAILAVYLVWVAGTRIETAGVICETPVVVEVLNGCGVNGLAEDVGWLLSENGCDIMFIGNADDFQYDESVVVDRSGDRSKAIEVARVLGGKPVVCQVSGSCFVDVTVVVGNDLAEILP
jgi:hypothetical protein